MCIRLDNMKRDRRFVVIAGNSKRRITRLASQTRMQPAASINVNTNGRTDGRTDAIAMAIANADARKNRLHLLQLSSSNTVLWNRCDGSAH